MSYLENFNYQITDGETKPKLVFLHGLMGSGMNWRSIASQFEEQYQILTYDQRGHGKSFRPASGYRPEDYAEDLNKILDELGWQKIHLIGHSMGGRAAMQFAAMHPGKLITITIEDIGIYIKEQNADGLKQMIEMVPVPFSSRSEARSFFKDEFPGLIHSNKRAKAISSYFYTNIVETPSGTADWRFCLKGIYESISQGHLRDRVSEWKSIHCPILLMRGDESSDLTQEDFTKMLSINSNAKGVEIPESGHWIHFDQAEAFVRELKSFLSQHS